jgi:hypothetical protein
MYDRHEELGGNSLNSVLKTHRLVSVYTGLQSRTAFRVVS